MNTITFLDLAKKVLEEANEPVTVEEIWDYAVSEGYDKQLATKGKTPWATLGARLFVTVRDDPNTPFVKLGQRPTRFFLKSRIKGNEDELLLKAAINPISKVPAPKYQEKDLHPLLAYYANLFLRAYTKTISHLKSEKKGFGEWVHPDMVGCYFPIGQWEKEVVEFSGTTGGLPIKVFSFELKRELSLGNLREYFFQTVSNSSWANESYLVTAEISKDEDFLNELRRLTKSFGVGVIRLDVKDPDSSEIIFPAETRDNLDWETVNKLASMNPDFREFLKRVKNDVTNQEIIKEKYDKVFQVEEIVKRLNSVT